LSREKEINCDSKVNLCSRKIPFKESLSLIGRSKKESMSLETIKISLAKQLLNVEEESVLMQIKSILDNEVIAAYTIDGKPLSVEEYNASLNDAEKDITEGRTIDSTGLKEEVKSWRKH
jgi:carbonic anhydrase